VPPVLARDIEADMLIMATDAQAVFVGFGTPQQRAIVAADPGILLSRYESEFAAGSMLSKVIAASDFAKATGKPAMIGALADIDAMLAGDAGFSASAARNLLSRGLWRASAPGGTLSSDLIHTYCPQPTKHSLVVKGSWL
jgi:hypothetical protein